VPVIVPAATGIDTGLGLLLPPKALRAMTEGDRRLYAGLAGSVTQGEYRPLDDVVRAVQELGDMAAR
jgi:hypothetical protein